MGYSILSKDCEFFGQVIYFNIDLTFNVLGYTFDGIPKILKPHTSKEEALQTIKDIYLFYDKHGNDMIYNF